MTPKTTERYTIPGPAGALEVVLNRAAAPTPRGIALVAHPHPLQGGTLDNKVAQTLAKTFFALGYAARALQLPRRRRVATARSTTGAARPTTRWRRSPTRGRDSSTAHGLPVVLAGFSFGSYVQTRVARGRRTPSGWCWSARRSSRFAPSRRFPPTPSSIHGEEDDVVPLADVLRLGAAAGAAGGRVSRLRPLLPRPAAAAAADRRRHVARPGAGDPRRMTVNADSVLPSRGLRKSLRRHRGRPRPVASRSGAASASACSGPTARARRRRCAAASASSIPTAATIDDGRRAGAAGGARRAHPRRRGAAAGQPRPRLHRHREPRRLRPLLRHSTARRSRRASRSCSSSPASGTAPTRHPHAVRRHEAPAHARPRAGQRPGPADPRRADDRASTRRRGT